MYTVRDRCRHNIVIRASYRHIRDGLYRNVLVFVVPLCFKDILVDLFGPTGKRNLYP